MVAQNRPPVGKDESDRKQYGPDIWSGMELRTIQRTIHRDLRDLYFFYLDETSRHSLASMGKFKRTIWVIGWLAKSLFLKLSPVRRLLFLVAIWMGLMGRFTFDNGPLRIDFHFAPVGIALLVIVLMLELKDKLLARDELEVGRAVQLALMPDRNPAFPGWEIWLATRPANDVGGDLVDYLQTGSSRLWIALGDVTGKGLGAALLMAKLQSTLRALATGDVRLEELGAQVNRILCRDGLPGRFATLAFLDMEPDSGRIRLLNAGHLPPVRLGPREYGPLPAVAPPLGILPDAVYQEQTIQLDPGDMLVAYSDGLTDARNDKDEFFGEERLSSLLPTLRGLSCESAGKLLLTQVDHFVGDAPPFDDLSLVLIRRLS